MAAKAKKKAKRKPGRPAFQVTAAVCKEAEEAAAKGASGKEIAARLGISHATLIEKKKEYFELIEAIDRGVARSIETVRNALFVNATEPATDAKGNAVGAPSGSVEAQKFFLQSRAGDKVNNSLEVKGDGEAPLAVRIILPSNGRKD